MRSKKLSTRAGGDGGSDGGDDAGESSSTTCNPVAEMNESILLDAKDLLEMLRTSTPEGEEEYDKYEEEEWNLQKDLDARFKSADTKRKFSKASSLAIGGASIGNANGSCASRGMTGLDGVAVCPPPSSAAAGAATGMLVFARAAR